MVSREGTDSVRLAFPELGEAELAEVRAVLESGALTMGPKVGELEQLVAAACGVEHAVAVSNGTAALHLAVLALGIGAGDEVIVPAYTFPATANVVRLAGATPVLVDVDPATFNLDVAKVYEAVTPRTKAVLAVHLFGRPLDWEELQNAVPPEVLLLEDAAGALGAKWRGMPCGGLGTMGCLSFHPRKIVTTGEGGAVTTGDADLAASIRRHATTASIQARTSPSPPRTTGSRTSSARSGSRSCDGSTICSPGGRGSQRPTRTAGSMVDVPEADEGDTRLASSSVYAAAIRARPASRSSSRRRCGCRSRGVREPSGGGLGDVRLDRGRGCAGAE